MIRVSLIPITLLDIDVLLPICVKTFYDAFYHLCKPSDFEQYIAKAFTTKKLRSELDNPDSYFYFATVDGAAAGYLKLNFNNAQSELKDENSMEIERIYILDTYQGQKIGQQLMEFALRTANDKSVDFVWLGVWEKNPNAVRFYERNGFKIFGKHTFEFGEETDSDWMMRRDV